LGGDLSLGAQLTLKVGWRHDQSEAELPDLRFKKAAAYELVARCGLGGRDDCSAPRIRVHQIFHGIISMAGAGGVGKVWPCSYRTRLMATHACFVWRR
jgi:hypothetical protein